MIKTIIFTMVLCLFIFKQGQGQQRLIHPTTTVEVLWCFVFKWFFVTDTCA